MNAIKRLIKENDKVNIHVVGTVAGAVIGVVLGFLVNRAATPEMVIEWEGSENEDFNG